MTAYDPADGKKLWWVGGLSFEMKSTPIIKGDTLYINGFGSPQNNPGSHVTIMTADEAFTKHDANKDGKLVVAEMPTDNRIMRSDWGSRIADLDADKALTRDEWDYYKAAMDSDNGILAIRLGGSGDMTAKSVRWKYHRGIPQLPSPLIYENVLYMVNDGGSIVTMLNPETGELIEQGRLEGAPDKYYASPVAGDGKIYIASEKGRVFVLPPGGTLEGHRHQRPGGQHLRHPGAGRWPHLPADPEHALRVRYEVGRVFRPRLAVARSAKAGKLSSRTYRLTIRCETALPSRHPHPPGAGRRRQARIRHQTGRRRAHQRHYSPWPRHALRGHPAAGGQRADRGGQRPGRA